MSSVRMEASASAAQVMAHHAVACHAIVVAKPGAICKTTSGKVQRQACRAAFLAGEYTAVRGWVLLQPYSGFGVYMRLVLVGSSIQTVKLDTVWPGTLARSLPGGHILCLVQHFPSGPACKEACLSVQPISARTPARKDQVIPSRTAWPVKF